MIPSDPSSATTIGPICAAARSFNSPAGNGSTRAGASAGLIHVQVATAENAVSSWICPGLI